MNKLFIIITAVFLLRATRKKKLLLFTGDKVNLLYQLTKPE